MTSEGHYAGRPPAEATSGGQAEPYGENGYPPDPDRPGRAPASGAGDYPTSYAPPPQSTPNGGSPFVVPTVFGQSAPQAPAPPVSGGRPYPEGERSYPDAPHGPSFAGGRPYPETQRPPAGGGRPYTDAPQPPMAEGRPYPETPSSSGGRPYPETPYSEAQGRNQGSAAYPGQAPVPDAAERMTPPPFAPPMSGSARVPGAGEAPPVQRAAVPPRNAPTPMPPRDVPAPPMPQRDARPPFRDGPAQPREAPVSPRATGSASVGGPAAAQPFGPRPGEPGPPFGPRPGDSGPRPGDSGPRPGDSGPVEPFGPHRFAPPNRNADPDESPFERRTEPDNSRPAGPMFGDQRARVPGATLNGLPDAPPSAQQPHSPAPRPGGDEESPAFPPAFGPQGFRQPLGRPAADDGGFNAFGPVNPPGDDRRGPVGQDRPASPSPGFGADRPASPGPGFGGDGPANNGPGFGADRPASPGPSFGPPGSGGPGFAGSGTGGPGFGEPRPGGPGFGGRDQAGAGPDRIAGQDFGPDRGPDRGRNLGPDRGPDRGPNFGPDRASDRGQDFGPGRGPNFGAPRMGAPEPGPDRGPEPRVPERGRPEQGGSDRGPGPDFGAAQDREGPARDHGGAAPDHGPMRGGFAQRVPGASLAASGMPVMAEPRGDAGEARNGGEPWNGSVPQPRDPAGRSVVGSARAVSASASVPVASRVAPPDAEEAPRTGAPQPRVYGRATPPVVTGEEPADDPYPNSGAPAPAGRAAASARVGMPPAEPNTPGRPGPYAEPTTDVAGRGRAGEQPDVDRFGPPDHLVQDGRLGQIDRPGEADYFDERADERSGYGQPFGLTGPQQENGHPYAHEHRALGGAFPGQVADETPRWAGPGGPPRPQAPGAPAQWGQGGEAGSWAAQGGQTSTWPTPSEAPPRQGGPGQSAPGQDHEQGRFDQYAAEQPAGAVSVSPKPETPHVRMFPVLLGVVIAAVLLVGVAIGVVWLISRGSDSGFSVSAGDCVKRSGNEAVKANCSDPGSFKVVSIADTKDKCADPKQPYVVNPTKNGKTQVLCLKPSS